MANKDDVDVFLFKLVNVNIFVLGPLSGHESLNVNLWVAFSDNDFFFLFDNNFLGLRLLLIFLGFILFFLFLIELEVVA